MLKIYTIFWQEKAVRRLCTSLAFLCMLGWFIIPAAQAQTSPRSEISQETADKIIDISQRIQRNYGIAPPLKPELTGLSEQSRLIGYHEKLSELANNDFDESTQTFLSEYETLAEAMQSERDIQNAKIFGIYFALRARNIPEDRTNILLEQLAQFKKSSDWFIQYRAYLTASELELNGGNLNVALEHIQTAMKLIPNASDSYSKTASFEANGLISAIYLYTANLEFAAQATDEFVSQGIALGKDIDGLVLLNNFIFGLQKWREFEVAETVAEIALDISRFEGPDQQAIAYYRYGQTLNSLGKYSKATQNIQEGLKLVNKGIWKIHLESQLAIAMAGLGNESGARQRDRKSVV